MQLCRSAASERPIRGGGRATDLCEVLDGFRQVAGLPECKAEVVVPLRQQRQHLSGAWQATIWQLARAR